MLHILNRNEEIVGTLSNRSGGQIYWEDNHHEKTENAFNTYEFKTIEDGPYTEQLINKNLIVLEDLDGLFFPFTIENTRKEFSNGTYSRYAKTTSIHVAELRTAKPLLPQTLTGATLSTASNTVLSATPWEPGIVEFSGSQTIEFENALTPLAALHKLANAFDVELRFRVTFAGNRIYKRYVDFIKRVGYDRGKELVVGKDIVSVTREEESADVFTALLGIGQADEEGNFTYVEVQNEEARQTWGKGPDREHLWGIYEVQSEGGQAPTQAEVQEKTEAALEKAIESKIKFTLDAADLERQGFNHERLRKGDTVRAKVEGFNPPLYLEARVLETKRSYTDKSKSEFAFGNYLELNIRRPDDIKEIQKLLFRKSIVWDSKSRYVRSTTPPDNTSILWIDTSVDPNVPRTHDGTNWIDSSPTTAGDLGAYTQFETDTKDQGVYDDATYYADQVSGTAEQNAKDWTDQYALMLDRLYNGVEISSVGGFTSVRNDDLVQMTANASTGFLIESRKAITDPFEPSFYVDSAGNVFFAGQLLGATGTFSGKLTTSDITGNVTIEGSSIKSDLGDQLITMIGGIQKIYTGDTNRTTFDGAGINFYKSNISTDMDLDIDQFMANRLNLTGALYVQNGIKLGTSVGSAINQTDDVGSFYFNTDHNALRGKHAGGVNWINYYNQKNLQSGTAQAVQSASTRLSATVNHGLGYTPSKVLVSIKWVSGAHSVSDIAVVYAENYNSTSFTVRCTNMPGASFPSGAYIYIDWIALRY